jgi:uncharacterized protein (TIGR03118 family)
LALNCSDGFPITNASDTSTRTAFLITPTKTGDVVAYNPIVNPRRGYVVINNKTAGEIAEYTGIAIANGVMYLADFFNGHIDVFDSNYNRIGIQGRNFIDNFGTDPIPASYGPHNVAYIAPYIYIMYAEREPGNVVHHIAGPGKGYISVFTLDGAFVRRFYSRGVLNAPYSIIPAPCECGIPPNSFLVNNSGDGRVNLFDYSGNYIGPLLAMSGLPIVIPGLQSLTAHYTTFSEIYFSSSDDIETRGVLGSFTKDQVIYV